jgi:hypothetical protein
VVVDAAFAVGQGLAEEQPGRPPVVDVDEIGRHAECGGRGADPSAERVGADPGAERRRQSQPRDGGAQRQFGTGHAHRECVGRLQRDTG